MKKSKHAKKRFQQRGIKNSHIELILKYGILKQKNGAYECFIPRVFLDNIRCELKKKLQDLDKISKANKTVLIMDGTVITAYNKN